MPIIGCDCTVCTSTNPKNKRRRVSVFIETAGVNLLIDTSPDLREQALENNIRLIDGVLYTHDHSDHVNGLDDLRRFGYLQKSKINIYGNSETIDSLQKRYEHAFGDVLPEWGWYKLRLQSHVINPSAAFSVRGVDVMGFEQIHGKYKSLGYRIGNFAYSTDVSNFSDECFDGVLQGLDLWVVDCQGYADSSAHSIFEKTLKWIERVKPKRAILTHMGHEFDYDKIKSELPEGVEPGYDNMKINI